MRMPAELLAVLVGTAVLAAYLTYTIREDFNRPDGSTDWWGLIEGLLSQYFIVAMLLSAALQVFVRYLFSDDIDLPWTEEFGRLALVWAAFWGAASLQRIDDHIRMTVLYDVSPPGAQWLMRIMGDVIILAVLLPLTWLGWQTARGLDIMHTISLGLPLSIFVYPVPIAGALMSLHTLILLIRRFTGREQFAISSTHEGA